MATAFESTDSFTPHSRHIAVVAAGLSDPSSTTMLGNQLSETAAEALSQRGHKAEVHHFELREVATDIAESMVTFTRAVRTNSTLNEVQQADAVIAFTPVFEGSYAALFKSSWESVDKDALSGVPMKFGATAGSIRLSLVIYTSMSALLSYLGMPFIST